MYFPQRHLLLLTVAITIGLSATSCRESKIAQCNKIIQVANHAVSEAKMITSSPNSQDFKLVNKAADLMEKASGDMEKIVVKDQKLQDYKSGFINMYRDSSKAMRNFALALNKQDRKAADAALINLQQANTPEKQLVNDLNTYCSSR